MRAPRARAEPACKVRPRGEGRDHNNSDCLCGFLRSVAGTGFRSGSPGGGRDRGRQPTCGPSGADPVKSGLVDSLGRPAGNLTGVGLLINVLAPKP
jgi:hypothetical protein